MCQRGQQLCRSFRRSSTARRTYRPRVGVEACARQAIGNRTNWGKQRGPATAGQAVTWFASWGIKEGRALVSCVQISFGALRG